MTTKKAPEKFRFAVMAVDMPVYGFKDGELCALVSEVNRPPYYVDMLGFLGGIVDATENAEEAARRVLLEKGGLKDFYIEQLYTFSEVHRDKRNRVVSVAHLGLVRPEVVASYKHESAYFTPVKKIKGFAYDHDEMHQVAMKRLQGKLAYSNIAQFLLPRHFTLTELQTAYEIILHKEFDKRNFRKKILALEIVKETGRMQEGVKNRPAALYEFADQKMQELPLLI